MFCPNCGSKLEDDANFCTNCGYKIGAPLTGAENAGPAEAEAQQAAPANNAQEQTNQQRAGNAGSQAGDQKSAPKRDWSLPLIDNEKLPAGIRNMPAHNFNALALIGAIVGLVLGLISLVFLIPVHGGIPLDMGIGGGAIAVYVVFLVLFIAGLILTVTTEVLGGIHWARKADYRGLVAVLIANFVEFIMMFVMIPSLNFFSRVSNLVSGGGSGQLEDLADYIDYGMDAIDAIASYVHAPSIAAGIVMIVISIAVIVVIAKFTAPDPVDKGPDNGSAGSNNDPVETVNI